jgi:quercetin dioxygenase-like cupin family protein
MKLQASTEIPLQPVDMEGSSGCQVRWLVDQHDGAPNFAMRQFEVAPGGFTPCHHHPYEHEVYVLAGEGTIQQNDQIHPLKAGDVVLVEPDEVHQFRNTGSTPLTFLCLVPNSAGKGPGRVQPECGAV